MSDYKEKLKIYQFDSRSDMLSFMESCDYDSVGCFLPGDNLYQVTVFIPIIGGKKL